MRKAAVSIQESDSAINVAKTNALRPSSSSSFLPLTRSPLVAGSHSISNITKPLIQPKLKIGAPNDRYEQEADRVADQVMRMPELGTVQTQYSQPQIQRMCLDCEEELQRQPQPNSLQINPVANTITSLVQCQEVSEEEEEEVQPGYDQEPEEPTPILESVPTRDAGELGEEDFVQAKSTTGKVPQVTPGITYNIQSLKGSGQPLPASERAFFEPRFGRDFSRVKIHTDKQAGILACSLNAKAFTFGENVVFGAGRSQVGSNLASRRLLAHELTHVVQQGGGPSSASRGVIQRKRIPPRVELEKLVTKGKYDRAAHRAGVERLISLAKAEMTSGEYRKVRRSAWLATQRYMRTHRLRYVPLWRQRLFLAEAIYKFHSKFKLGPAGKGDKPARPRSQVKTLVDLAKAKMALIDSSVSSKKFIDNVFGPGHSRYVKRKFQNASKALTKLYNSDKICVDPSGYLAETGIGGVTTKDKVFLQSNIIAKPADPNSLVTTIHESLHAGNLGVIVDVSGGYNEGEKTFREFSSRDKLKNAAHYGVIAWRMIDKNNKRAHIHNKTKKLLPFTPTTRRITPRTSTRVAKQIVLIAGPKKAMAILTNAVAAAGYIYVLFRGIYNQPRQWKGRGGSGQLPRLRAGIHYKDVLPFWSKVENLTVHKRGKIDPTSSIPSEKPVTLIDLAISEGVVRRVNLTRSFLPDNPNAAGKFIKKYASSRVWARAQGNVELTALLLIRRILRHKVRRITGKCKRDYAVITMLANNKGSLNILQARDPKKFKVP